jgi:hypothetical protein
MEGFITIHRKILDWEWYSNSNVMRVFIHCLLRANYQERSWQGNVIGRGQFVTSVSKLSRELGLTPRQISGALDKLKMTNEIAIKTSNRNTTITICKYDDYQTIGSNECKTKRKAERQTNVKQNVKQKENKCKQINNNNNNNNQTNKNTTPNGDSKKKTSQVFDIKGYLKGKGVSTQHINDWLQVRKVKKGVNTLTAMENIDKEVIKAGITWDEAVTYCIIHNWVGFKAAWYNREGRSGVPAPFQNNIHPGNVEERDRDVPLLEGNIPGVDYAYIKRLRDEQARKGKLKPKANLQQL